MQVHSPGCLVANSCNSFGPISCCRWNWLMGGTCCNFHCLPLLTSLFLLELHILAFTRTKCGFWSTCVETTFAEEIYGHNFRRGHLLTLLACVSVHTIKALLQVVCANDTKCNPLVQRLGTVMVEGCTRCSICCALASPS